MNRVLKQIDVVLMIIILFMVGIFIASALYKRSVEHEKATHKYQIEIGNKEFDNCTYKSGRYYTETGGKIDFGREANVIRQK